MIILFQMSNADLKKKQVQPFVEDFKFKTSQYNSFEFSQSNMQYFNVFDDLTEHQSNILSKNGIIINFYLIKRHSNSCLNPITHHNQEQQQSHELIYQKGDDFEWEFEQIKVQINAAQQSQLNNYFIFRMNYSIFTLWNGSWNQPSFPLLAYCNIDSNYSPSFNTYHYAIQNSDLQLSNNNIDFNSHSLSRCEEANQNIYTPSTVILQKQQEENPINPQLPNKIKYSKKNAESNVVNQVFSFLSIRSKSKKILSIVLGNRQDLISIYYQVIRQLKKKNKKYINRFYLKELVQLPENHLASVLLKKIDVYQKLGIELLKKALRILVNYYFESVSINAILTSSKLDKQTKYEHLQRKKEIEVYFKYHMKNGNRKEEIQ